MSSPSVVSFFTACTFASFQSSPSILMLVTTSFPIAHPYDIFDFVVFKDSSKIYIILVAYNTTGGGPDAEKGNGNP